MYLFIKFIAQEESNMEELLATNQFNQVYERLFNLFMSGLKKKHKREYYKFSFKNKTISGRCILPEVSVDLEATEKRAYEFFRYEYPETKFYSNPLIKQIFPEMFLDVFEDIMREDFQSEAEILIDRLVDEILTKKL
jgi:hypothetical protein